MRSGRVHVQSNVPKPPAGLSVAASHTPAVQSGDKAGPRLRPEACAAVMGQGILRHRPREWADAEQSERATLIVARGSTAVTLVRPKPRRCRWPCFARTITGRRRSSGARCRSVGCDRTKMFRLAVPPRGSLLTGLDGAAGSRRIESIHVVNRSASRLPDAMSP
jgi:hypothetical protein